MLDSVVVAGAGARHLREHGHHGGLQGVQSVVGGPVDCPLAGALHVVVKGVAVRAAWGPHFLPPEVL